MIEGGGWEVSVCAPACENTRHTRQSHSNSQWVQEKQGGGDKLLIPKGQTGGPQRQHFQWSWLEIQVGTVPSWRNHMLCRRMHLCCLQIAPLLILILTWAGQSWKLWDETWRRVLHLGLGNMLECTESLVHPISHPDLSNCGDAVGNSCYSGLLLTSISMLPWEPKTILYACEELRVIFLSTIQGDLWIPWQESTRHKGLQGLYNDWEPRGLQLHH